MSLRNILFLILALAVTKNGWSQNKPPAAPYNFLPREKVIFEDNFENDTVGSFPSKWRITKCIGGKKDSAGIKFYEVANDSMQKALVFPAYTESHLEQDINSNHSVNDIFSIELDFNLGPEESHVAIDFQIAEKLADCRSVFLSVSQAGIIHYTTLFPKYDIIVNHFPGYFDRNLCHHLAVSFFKGSLSYYVDQYKIASIPVTAYHPLRFGISARGPARVKNFRIATGPEVNEFFDLLKTKKLVSRSFQFYYMRGAIQSISMRHVLELAQFLKANPSQQLEIGVHTDNDGEPVISKRVSQARADEIKHQLELAGIDAKRLTATGFGDTVPLKPNNTPEGMAANNRVEFLLK